ncbi:hypothetical protein [Prevotella falsenii]|uniref:hypothetical protein n=1 Tax=Prevotella falsenii TaxID=515414 RepID=UPI0012EB56A2|nr:hypothetical protein [Prevotella falsenii]
MEVCFGLLQTWGCSMFYGRKEGNKSVNIYSQLHCCVTILLSVHSKTYCFALQNLRFCTVKAAVLRCKTYGFAMPKRNYHFSSELYLQNQSDFSAFLLNNESKTALAVLQSNKSSFAARRQRG